ncbi:DUF6088 family protein [Pseudomonas sp. W03]|uniref:DUF6088 family protein n=1 Tax=Pseudomonas sp. W03 TaxID=3090666 RepID=UPI003A4DDDF5
MTTLPEAIIDRSKLLPEGDMLTAKEFLHLGSRAAVDQAFSRLAKSGLLLRVTRGLYVAPKAGLHGREAPAVEKVVSSLASKTQEVIAADGAQSAKMLDLPTQGAVGYVFLTSGRARTLKVGGVTVELRHAPKWMLSLGASTAGSVIRALAWLGEAHVSQVMVKLRENLSTADWQALSSARYLLPSWMAQAIGREVV